MDRSTYSSLLKTDPSQWPTSPQTPQGQSQAQKVSPWVTYDKDPAKNAKFEKDRLYVGVKFEFTWDQVRDWFKTTFRNS